MNLEQHFLNKKGKNIIKKTFSSFNFLEKEILELGSGKGDLTEEILFQNPKSITCIEIDTLLKNKASGSNKVILINKDINLIDFSLFKGFICVSAPPYSLIENIYEDLNKMEYILVISEKYFKYFEEFKVIGELEADMFLPNSKKRHYIITNIKGK